MVHDEARNSWAFTVSSSLIFKSLGVASGSSLTPKVKPANPANCHGKVREVKEIILHCRLWLIFWHWENNFCQQKQNLQSMGWGTESQIDRAELTAVPGPILCALSTLTTAVRAVKLSHADPNYFLDPPQGLYLQNKFWEQEGNKVSKPLQGCVLHFSGYSSVSFSSFQH